MSEKISLDSSESNLFSKQHCKIIFYPYIYSEIIL